MSLQKLEVKQFDDCTVARVPWLHVTVYPSQSKAIAEFVDVEDKRGGVALNRCRFCEVDLDDSNRRKEARAVRGVDRCRRWLCEVVEHSCLSLGVQTAPSLALEQVCDSAECREKTDRSCVKTLACGHVCGGVRDEGACLPCYFGAVVSSSPPS